MEVAPLDGKLQKYLSLSSEKPTPSENVYAAGHPLGRPLTYTRCCGFFEIDGTLGTHDCPTFTGGSGGPILDSASNVVVAVNALTDYDDPNLKVVEVEKLLAAGATFRSRAIIVAGNAFIEPFRSR
jgi:V8-like Glu-specific endopeptidase